MRRLENQNKRILVCDDDKSILNLLNTFLQDKGYTVTTTDNGLDAKNLIKKNRFDAVLTDVTMPRTNGFEILSFAKSLNQDTNYFVMTGLDTPDLEKRVKEMNGKELLRKPFSFDKLSTTLDLYLKPKENEKCRVLIVDDDLQIRRILFSVLHPNSYDVGVASNGKDAISMVKNMPNYFDIILTDICMGEIDGNEVIKAIQKYSPATLCIAISGEATDEEISKCYKSGAWNMIRKPFDIPTFLHSMKNFEFVSKERRSKHGEAENEQKKPLITKIQTSVKSSSNIMSSLRRNKGLKSMLLLLFVAVFSFLTFHSMIEFTKQFETFKTQTNSSIEEEQKEVIELQKELLKEEIRLKYREREILSNPYIRFNNEPNINKNPLTR